MLTFFFFLINKFPFKPSNSKGSTSTNFGLSGMINHALNDSVKTSVEPRKIKRPKVAKDFGTDFQAYTLEEYPKTLQEALTSLDANSWQEAINDEMDSLESNGTWHLVDLPPGCKTIGCKWILNKKLKAYRNVDKFKAMLVAKGFRQQENVDFFDSFSPVTRITSIRVLFILAYYLI